MPFHGLHLSRPIRSEHFQLIAKLKPRSTNKKSDTRHASVLTTIVNFRDISSHAATLPRRGWQYYVAVLVQSARILPFHARLLVALSARPTATCKPRLQVCSSALPLSFADGRLSKTLLSIRRLIKLLNTRRKMWFLSESLPPSVTQGDLGNLMFDVENSRLLGLGLCLARNFPIAKIISQVTTLLRLFQNAHIAAKWIRNGSATAGSPFRCVF